ncbi:hypothetical protein [Flavobacterium sp.]|jgi:hypothetical protein|uniref:hypothetical protein n=1 Tax=Flavobacterium sp. TaxID=239 RepID=UPI0037BFF285
MTQLLKFKYIFYSLLLVSFLSSLRNLLLPLVFDELQYAEIGKNMITKGEYSLFGSPSTFTPILPFLVSLFYIKSCPAIGFAFVKFANLSLMIVGLRYCFLYLKKLDLPGNIALLIVLVTAVNNSFITWSTVIYPESILFCAFWIFIYNVTGEIKTNSQVIGILIPIVILMITRYLYAVLGVVLLYVVLQYVIGLYKEKKYNHMMQLVFISLLCFLPLLIWFKYVFSIESNHTLNQSYFTRFKNNDVFYNIKAGLGILKHDEVDKVNGIPAFVSLFAPVTGLRNWLASIVLILFFSIGLLSKWSSVKYRILALSIFLIMLGLILAGTGFSRYWLVLLPGFWLGFYEFFNLFRIKEKYFIYFVILLSTLYVMNEVRLDYIILKRL